MNLRDIGTAYEDKSCTLWVNPANSPMMVDIVRSQLDRLQPYDTGADEHGDHRVNNARTAFMIAEGFVVDSDFKLNTTLANYYASRGKLQIHERWYLFLMMVETADCAVLYDAYNATRLKAVEETETDSQKKQPKPSESVAPTPNDSVVTQPA